MNGQILDNTREVLCTIVNFLPVSLRKLFSLAYFASLTPAFQRKWLLSRIMSGLFWSHCLSLSGKKWTVFQSTPEYELCDALFFWGQFFCCDFFFPCVLGELSPKTAFHWKIVFFFHWKWRLKLDWNLNQQYILNLFITSSMVILKCRVQ